MNRVYIFFVAILLLLLNTFPLWSEWSYSMQAWICIGLIGLLGIPHGAIDHIIYLEESDLPEWKFYMVYLGGILLYIVLWLWLPGPSMITFLLLSSYHFGQSQLSDLPTLGGLLEVFLESVWGITIISALVLFNYPEVKSLLETSGIHVFEQIFLLRPFTILWVSGLGLTLLGFLITLYKGLSVENLLTELFILGLIHLCFYLFPLLISFTFFFIVLHSIKVLGQEYRYLKEIRGQFTVQKFIYALMPFTLLSLLGIVIIIYSRMFGWIGIPELLLAFIIISVITLPHTFVMEVFYKKSAMKREHKSEADQTR